MRVGKYITKNNISLKTLNYLRTYLLLEKVTVHFKLMQEEIELLNNTLNSDRFLSWLNFKKKTDFIEVRNCLGLVQKSELGIKFLAKNKFDIKRVYNAIKYLKNNYYNSNESIALEIDKAFKSNKNNSEIVILLLSKKLFVAKKRQTQKNINDEIKEINNTMITEISKSNLKFEYRYYDDSLDMDQQSPEFWENL